jgi:hypothetical protein
MKYAEMLQERKNSPASRITAADIFFDDRNGWNTTVYSMFLNTKKGVRRMEVVAQTTCMMIVEK